MLKLSLVNGIFIANGEITDFKCSQCYKFIGEGFICEEDNRIILCNKCQEEYKMVRCRHDKVGEHRHIKWFKQHDNIQQR
jgi:NAD-dependent SIR2 family protein deacetylase